MSDTLPSAQECVQEDAPLQGVEDAETNDLPAANDLDQPTENGRSRGISTVVVESVLKEEMRENSCSMDDVDANEKSRPDNVFDINVVPPNDVKNIILQVLSPYFDDDGGEDDAQRYDHIKAQGWIQLICDGIMEKLLALRRPYKYVVHCMVMRKCGAGIHVCSSCYYSQADGWVNHAHDLSAHIYAVVTVYWSVI